MSLVIKEVQNKKDFKKFIMFPFKLYSGNKFWIPPLIYEERNNLREDKNPAYEFCEAANWLVYKDGKIAGRISGIINKRYNEKTGKNIARFSRFDFIDDYDVSAALIETVEKWAKSKSAVEIQGPLGFTDMDPEGMLIEGFEELGTIATIYNYPYYPDHIKKLGYQKDTDWLEYQLFPTKSIPEKIERIAAIVKERNGLKILKVKKAKDLLPYAHEIFEVLNAAYKDIFGFVSLTEKQIDLYIKQYFGFIIPDYVPVILNEQNQVVAFAITMPSLSKAFQKCRGRIFPFGFIHILRSMKKTNNADLYLIGVRPDYQDKGVNAIIICEINKVFSKYNITTVESNPELESNAKIHAQWRFYESRQHKRRRCFIKSL
ncbi:MAG: hypothetical protein CVV23_07745 [Ignavibacteriae bacterium HGW-Ignavibacteriae-2]|jgi:hypothetical protein|nr:hypothetical protein [Bacteroidota bacterium]PKL88899.1 MAG: hypothetical protein CVV23_07745 [Ignavibacteriae bacterium HGW-Ignavibacteriae-2]